MSRNLSKLESWSREAQCLQLTWGSLRLLDRQAFLIVKFRHQQFTADSLEAGLGRQAGHLPGPLAKLQSRQSCFCHHLSF